MPFGQINRTDITSNISQLKGAYPQGAARKTLGEVLRDLVSTTNVDMKCVDIILPDGRKMNMIEFVKLVDSTNDLPLVYLFQKACKDPKIIAEEVIPKVEKFKSDQKWHSGAEPVRITLDLRSAQAKSKSTSNLAMGMGPLNLQEVMDPNRNIKQTGNASTLDEKDNGFKFTYSEKWVIGLLGELGFSPRK